MESAIGEGERLEVVDKERVEDLQMAGMSARDTYWRRGATSICGAERSFWY